MRSISPASSTTPPQTAGFSQRTPWHSPVPYLFGGLAAMLGLIAFALLILACSYWKLSVQSEERERQERDLEAGNNAQNDEKFKDNQTKIYEEKILVIMAGDQKPTFLATPVTAPKLVPPFIQSNVSSAKLHSSVEKQSDANYEKVKEMSHHESDQEEQKQEEEAE